MEVEGFAPIPWSLSCGGIPWEWQLICWALNLKPSPDGNIDYVWLGAFGLRYVWLGAFGLRSNMLLWDGVGAMGLNTNLLGDMIIYLLYVFLSHYIFTLLQWSHQRFLHSGHELFIWTPGQTKTHMVWRSSFQLQVFTQTVASRSNMSHTEIQPSYNLCNNMIHILWCIM
jgi:hypothetical protein